MPRIRAVWLLALLTLLLSGGCSRTRETGGGPPKPTGRRITIAMMPKLKGIDYFNACQRGAEEAAKELGNIDLIYDGPLEGKVDKQIEMIDGWITRGVDVIAVACNDPVAISPVLKRAKQAGIRVITWDADADAKRSGREFFVNQASPQSIGYELVDVMAEEVGPKADVAIITSSLTAPNQNEWIKWMKKRQAEKYPGLRIVDIKPSEEDQQLALRVTKDLLKANPNIKGVWGISSVAFPGAAEAVKQMGLSGKVAVTGLSTPASMRTYVKEGVVKTVVLWNAVDLGYLTVYAAKALYDGTLKPGVTSIKAGRLGVKQVKGDEVLLGPPMRFTKENIDQFNF